MKGSQHPCPSDSKHCAKTVCPTEVGSAIKIPVTALHERGLRLSAIREEIARSASEKTSASRTLKVKLHYTGTGTIDEKHKILVFLFDSPAFMQGDVIPFAMKGAASKDATGWPARRRRGGQWPALA